MNIQKKKKGTWAEVDHTITSPRAFSGLVFMRHEGPADEGFSTVQTWRMIFFFVIDLRLNYLSKWVKLAPQFPPLPRVGLAQFVA